LFVADLNAMVHTNVADRLVDVSERGGAQRNAPFHKDWYP
jgi:hypothetical protein